MVIFIWACHILIIFGLAYYIYRRETFFRILFWPSLFFKLLSGILVGLLYTYYYPVGDTFEYFKDASRIASVFSQDFSAYAEFLFFNKGLQSLSLTFYEPRAVFLTKIVSVFTILTARNYWIISLYFSFLSFLSAWVLVKTINRNVSSVNTPSFIAFLFLPSIVFWTSGLIKESLAVAALYCLTAFFLKIWFNERIRIVNIVGALISLWLFWNLKYYFLAIFLPVACATLLYKFIFDKRFTRSPTLELVVWISILTVPLFLISFLHPNFHLDRFLNVIVLNNTAFNKLSAPEDLIHYTNLQAEPASIIQNAPWALFSGLFRPLFWESATFLQVLLSIENTLLLLFFLTALAQIKIYLSSPHRILILALLVYVMLLCIFIAFSAPNFGTLSRYRSGYLSFFTFIILCNNPLLNYLERSFQRLVSH